MRKVKVNKGRHDFKRGSGVRFSTGTNLFDINSKGWSNIFDIEFSFDDNCWFDPSPSGPIQRDGKDINKLGGISTGNILKPRTWPKNRSSILVGFRPSEVKGFIELHGYVNFEDGSFKSVYLGAIATKTKGEVRVSLNKNDDVGNIKFHFLTKDSETTEYLHLDTVEKSFLDFVINVDPWFGGNRKSPQDMSLSVNQKNYI